MQSNSIQVNTLVLSKDALFSTIQGEGPRLGRPTTFMRLGGCNLKCSWCDTAYTWDWEKYDPRIELVPTSIHALADRLALAQFKSITVTGGEPFLQWRALASLFTLAAELGWKPFEINFETNGTKVPEWGKDVWCIPQEWGIVISPKLRNSGNSFLDKEDNIHALKTWHDKESLVQLDYKFVCQFLDDLDEVDEFFEVLRVYGILVDRSRTWIMPEGTDPYYLIKLTQRLVDGVISRGYNLTPRLHQYVWGNARAR